MSEFASGQSNFLAEKNKFPNCIMPPLLNATFTDHYEFTLTWRYSIHA
jgi:hypothetical protein